MAAFEARSGLIEAAPFPMWFRDTDLRLALVNLAYVRAVEAASATAVIDGGIELCEPVAGVSAAEAADRARADGSAQLRTVPVTIEGERSEEHTSELQSLMRNSSAVFCLKKKKK